jgi:hypothetical protein
MDGGDEDGTLKWLARYKRLAGLSVLAVLAASGGLYVLGPLLLRRLIKKWPPFHVALILNVQFDFRGGTLVSTSQTVPAVTL